MAGGLGGFGVGEGGGGEGDGGDGGLGVAGGGEGALTMVGKEVTHVALLALVKPPQLAGTDTFWTVKVKEIGVVTV